MKHLGKLVDNRLFLGGGTSFTEEVQSAHAISQ